MVVIVLGFVIWIGPDLIDESEHVAVNWVLNDAFKIAVDVYSRGVSLETVASGKSDFDLKFLKISLLCLLTIK